MGQNKAAVEKRRQELEAEKLDKKIDYYYFQKRTNQAERNLSLVFRIQ